MPCLTTEVLHDPSVVRDALNSIAHWPAWFALKKGQTILNELIELPRPQSKSDGPTPAESSAPEGVADNRFISESESVTLRRGEIL